MAKETEIKRGAHRPKVSVDELPDGWYDVVLDIYLNGGSDVEVKAQIYQWRGSFSNDLWDRWMREEPQFSETINTGKMLSEAWWSRAGRENLQNKEFSFTGWYMNMKNRFGWRDKLEQENSGEQKIIVETRVRHDRNKD